MGINNKPCKECGKQIEKSGNKQYCQECKAKLSFMKEVIC